MQMVNIVEGGERAQMSKRRGDFVTLDELIDDIGVDATRFFMLQRSHDTAARPRPRARALRLPGQPRLLRPVRARADREHPPQGGATRAPRRRWTRSPPAATGDEALAAAAEPAERALVRRLLELPGEVRTAAERRAPHRLCAYAMATAADFHAFYRDCRVVGAPEPGAAGRAARPLRGDRSGRSPPRSACSGSARRSACRQVRGAAGRERRRARSCGDRRRRRGGAGRRSSRLRLGDDDELIVADNTRGRRRSPAAATARSAWSARAGRAARPFTPATSAPPVAAGTWLLFIDADCVPRARPARPPLGARARAETLRVVAGEARGAETQGGVPRPLVAVAPRPDRLPSARRSVRVRPGRPRTCSCAATAFEAVGGFCEVRSDADVELCWRIQERGLALEYRPGAIVAHRDPEDLVAVVRQAAGYGAGRRWLRSSVRPGGPGADAGSARSRGPPPERSPGRSRCGSSARRSSSSTALVAAATWVGYRLGDNRA